MMKMMGRKVKKSHGETMPKNDIIKENELNKLYGKEVSVFVRYGFKKKIDEIQYLIYLQITLLVSQ